MELTLNKINGMADKAMIELTKSPITVWNSMAINTFKYIIDKLKSCVDELGFNLLKKDLNQEASILTKLSNDFIVLFDKMLETNQVKLTNPPELPIEYCQKQPNSTRTIFGGSEVQNFKIYASKRADFIEAEPTFKPNKQKVFKKLENKGTSTSEDALYKLFQGNIQTDAEKELIKLQEENEMNLLDLRKQLKLKGMWSEITSSHATSKLNDLNRNMEREAFKNDIYISDQIKTINEIEYEDEYDIKKAVKENIVQVQKKTAERIMRAAERKMRIELDQLALKKSAVLLMKKSKAQNFQRIEELEKLIKEKNDQVIEKEARINQLFQKFEEQERKFANLLKQIDNYKVTQQVEVCTTIVQKNGMKSDVEVQVSLVDPRVELFELKLQEMIDENEDMREELKLMHQQALEDKMQSLYAPKQIEEVILLLLQSDLSPENKIISLHTLLQYVKDNSEEIAKLAPNELYKIVRSKLKFNCESPLEKLDELSNDEDDSYERKSITKKKAKQKGKRMSQVEKQFDGRLPEQIDLDKVSTQRKQVFQESEEELSKSKKQQIQLIQVDDMKKSAHQKIEYVNSPVSTNRSNMTFRQKQSYLKTNRNNSAKNNINESSRKEHNSSSGFNGQQNSRPTFTQLESKSNKQSFTNFSSKELNLQQEEKHHKKGSSENQSDINLEFYKTVKTKEIGIQVHFKQPPQQEIPKNISPSPQIKQEVKQEQEVIKRRESQIYRPSKEVISQKSTQTDDFFLWNLFQKMAADLCLNEDQLKRLETAFLNEQQFIHYYEKTQSQKQISRTSSMQNDTQGDYRRESIKNLERSQGFRNSIKIRTGSQQQIYTTGDGQENFGAINNEQGDDDQLKNQCTQPTSWHSPVVSRQQSQIVFSGSQQQQYSYNQPWSPNGQNNMLRSNSPLNPNSSQGIRSVSQLINTGENVHVITYGTVSPNEQAGRNKFKTNSTSQRILDDMLKSKTQLVKSPDQQNQQREQKEQQLFYQLFGDETQNDEEFDIEAIRQNLGKPYEIIQDHMKEESIKKVFQQLAQKQKTEWKDQLYLIISKYCDKNVQTITYVDFKKYYENFMRVHKRCGEECIHIKRFLARIGFSIMSKRKQLNMSKSSVSPFDQFPKLK